MLRLMAVGGSAVFEAQPSHLLSPMTRIHPSHYLLCDPTRELYQDINPAFAKEWKAKTGDTVRIRQSHGGSGKQGRSVIDGMNADVVTLALAYDIDVIAERALVAKDWNDLIKPGVGVITPNPKTSGGTRWNHLAAWGYALKQPGGTEASAKEFLDKLHKNVPVLDSGARGSTVTFVERGISDVLISWENEAHLAIKELGPGKVDIIVPSISILAEPPVAVVDKVVDRRGTRKLAEAYLQFLYTDAAQDWIAKNYYRPSVPAFAKKYANQFSTVTLFTIDEVAGGWTLAQKTHFADGGMFDQIYPPK
jgi:ABC-type sulfate transport system substrate-binding protein